MMCRADNQVFWEYRTVMSSKQKIGRNDPCPCGSGKKYKKCCGAVHSRVGLYLTVLTTLGGAFFSWLLILRKVEGGPTEPIDPFMVGLVGFLGAVMGLGLGYSWARKASLRRKLVAFLTMAALVATIWALVPLGVLAAGPATAVFAIPLMLSWLRWRGHFQWPW